MRTSNKDRKTWMLSVRTSSELRAKLQVALQQSGRSLTQEVEMRLERSFVSDEFVGGAITAAFLNLLGASIKEIELKSGHSWVTHRGSWLEVAKLVQALMIEREPPLNIGPISDEKSDHGEAHPWDGLGIYGD